MYPAIKAALPKAGIASNLAGPIRDGPLDSGGAGVLSLYHYQGSARTAMLVEQVFKRTNTGKLLLTGIEDIVLEAGLYGPLWNMPFHQVSSYILQHSLVFDIWKYNYLHNIWIHTSHGELSPNRLNAIPIMLLASQHFTDNASLRSIQKVRMAMGVIHLSDICYVDGRSLDSRYLFTKFPSPSKKLLRMASQTSPYPTGYDKMEKICQTPLQY